MGCGTLVTLCGLLLGSLPEGAAERDRVIAVELHTSLPAPQVEELIALVTLVPGEPWSADEVRRTVRNLHAAGVASEIEVHRERRTGGEAAIVVLRPLARIASVQLRGELGGREKAARRLVQLRAGERLVEGRLLRTVYDLQDFYEERGFPTATVTLEVEASGEQRFDVAFLVSSGPRFSFGRVEVEGLPEGLDPLRRLETRTGRPVRRARLQEDEDRLRHWYVKQLYLTAEVSPARVESRPEQHRLDVVFPTVPGPLFEIRMQDGRRKELERRGLLPFLGEAGYDEALVLQSARRIRRYLQSKGHYRVQVDWREEQHPGRHVLSLELEPGPVFAVEEVSLEGNEQVAESVLRELLATRERRALVPGSGRLIDEVLAADLDNLRSFYRLQGFSGVRVGPAGVVEEGDRLTVSIPIVEGARRRVVSVDLRGVEQLREEELLASLPLVAGGAFHSRLLDDSQERLRAAYRRAGFNDAQLEPTLEWNESETLVDVTIRVVEGLRQEVDRVVVRGNLATRTGVVRRTVAMQTGDPVSPERLLNVQRDLYRLGLFSRVELSAISAPDDPGHRDLVIRVEETPPRRIVYGVGYNSDEGLGGLLGWSHTNLFGRGHSVGVDARVTTSNNGRFRLLYRQPIFSGWSLPFEYMLFRFDEDRPGFQVRSRGGQAVASWRHRRLRWGVRYDYRIVEPFNIEVPINEIERELQESFIAGVTGFLHFDRRNDPVDPSRGSSTRLETEIAFPMLSATAEYLRVFAEQSFYLDVRPWGVVALGLRAGAIEPRGEIENPALPSAEIPIVKRFFAGGRTTHRAYDRDLLGIQGETISEGDPVGGNGLLLVNLDFRFPVAGPVEGLVFVDAGNVWADWRNIRTSQMKLGTGVGVRYLSPVGPLRLEVGWKLDREPGEPNKAVFVSFGDPF